MTGIDRNRKEKWKTIQDSVMLVPDKHPPLDGGSLNGCDLHPTSVSITMQIARSLIESNFCCVNFTKLFQTDIFRIIFFVWKTCFLIEMPAFGRENTQSSSVARLKYNLFSIPKSPIWVCLKIDNCPFYGH